MIKLFVADMDGCLSFPFEQPHWPSIHRLMELNGMSESEETIPALTICTGRPLNYTEAIAQWMGLKLPFVFEGGGGTYHPVTNELKWSAFLDDETMQALSDIQHWIDENILTDYPEFIPEFTKKTHLGLVHNDEQQIYEAYKLVEEHVHAHYNQFETHYTDVSINVVHKEANKARGVKELSRLTGIKVSEMAYIGDGTNDIPAMELVGRAYAPVNSREEVKEVARTMYQEATPAVLAAFEEVIEENKREMAESRVG